MHFVSRFHRGIIAGACALGLLVVVVTARPQSPQNVATKATTRAQEIGPNRGAAALWQSLLKLHTRASMIMFTGHPDDEDGGVLTYESRGQGVRAALLTMNRGEGGQNEMSNDYWDALGLVRTEELLAADAYYGVQQYWTTVVDYGFSKTREEALEKWGHDRVLYDSVRVVRMTRPLVVTSVSVGGHTDGHGNHMVAGQMAQEVYKAAGDPNVFPDQIREGLRPWTPLKDYSRVPFRMSDNSIFDYADGHTYPLRFFNYIEQRWEPGALATNLEAPSGLYDPWLGYTFTQLARKGLGFQKSQNGGTNVPFPGPMDTPYHRWASRVPVKDMESSFFDGIDVSLAGIASLAPNGDTVFLKRGLSEINQSVEEAMRDFSPENLPKIAPPLAKGLKETNQLIEQVSNCNLTDDEKYNVNFELRIKQAQFNGALLEALQISVQANVAPERRATGIFALFQGLSDTFNAAIPGQQFEVELHVANQSSVPLSVTKFSLAGPEGEDWKFEAKGQVPSQLPGEKAAEVRFKVAVPESAAATRPYFTRPDTEQAYYDLVDPRYRNLPTAPYPLSGWVDFDYQGVPVRIGQVVQTVHRVTGLGPVLEPMVVVPAISVSISPNAGIVPLDAKTFDLAVTVESNVKGPAKGSVRLDLPSGWRSSPESMPFSTMKDGEDQAETFQVTPSSLEAKSYKVTAVASYEGKEYREGYHTVGYSGLRPYNLYRPAAYHTTGTDVKIPAGLNVGYITGTGDDVPATLEMLGIHVHFVSPQDIASGDLSKYDVIVMGVRAYAARPELRTQNGRLLEYVKNGGVIIVQYETMEYSRGYGPYPYTLTNDAEKVVDENSAVEILRPENPVFNWPNKITTNDFKGWIEERGHDFMKEWDPHYEALLETHDPNQDPQKGGLLFARYGKGVYVYSAFAFYRQLPEGIPGSFRIFANLVSLPRNPEVAAEKKNSQ
ncbi:MAG: PIG-L family deacetylase [Candidatus Acidiferrum sp.]